MCSRVILYDTDEPLCTVQAGNASYSLCTGRRLYARSSFKVENCAFMYFSLTNVYVQYDAYDTDNVCTHTIPIL